MNNGDGEEIEVRSCMWFVPPFANIHAGGASTIFKIANQLSLDNGCLNYFIFEKSVPVEWSDLLSGIYPDMQFEIRIFNYSNTNGHDVLPATDVAICTFWTTALQLVKYNSCHKKFYLLQDDERLFYPSGADSCLVEATYRFGFIGLANSASIKDSYSIKSLAKTYNYMPGINRELLGIEDYSPRNESVNIIAYARPSHSRNVFEILIYVLSELAEEYKEKLNIFLVGENLQPKEYRISSWIKVIGNVTDSKQAHYLYDKCDIGISLISTPTISYQQLDVLAAGRCLVAIKNGEIENVFSDEEIYYTSPFPLIMKNDIINLIENKNAITGYASKGRLAAQRLGWDITLKKISTFIRTA